MKRIEKKDFVFLFAENVDDPPFVQDLKNLKSKTFQKKQPFVSIFSN